jgi:hypothetical protein
MGIRPHAEVGDSLWPRQDYFRIRCFPLGPKRRIGRDQSVKVSSGAVPDLPRLLHGEDPTVTTHE